MTQISTYELWVQPPGKAVRRYELEAGAVIGRDATCDVVLDSHFVSRRHAHIEVEGDKHILVDEGSRNGTLLNGKRMAKSTRLQPGDEVRIAEFIIFYRRAGESESTRVWDASMLNAEVASVGVYLDASARELWVLGEKVTRELSKLEFDFLSLLYARTGEVVPSDEIGAELWGVGGYDVNMLHQLVARVKDKIEPDASHPRFVINIRGVGYRLQRGPDPLKTSGTTAVILFSDIADSTGMTERLGDGAFRDASRALDERLREAIRGAGGTPIDGKLLGDGVMAVFASAREAIDAALRCSDVSAHSELPLHLGIHAGDVIRELDNVYGGAVNIASRICGLSEPGEILVSDVVRGMARTSTGVTFQDRGEQEMKGVGDPVRVYAVGREDGSGRTGSSTT
jgi:class 3 adenylate cyclase